MAKKSTTSFTGDAPGIPNGVRVVAKAQGFRRAGRAWPVAPTDVLFEDLGDDALAQLRAEPMLSVTEIVIEAAR